MPTADRPRSRIPGGSRPSPADHPVGSRPYTLGAATPTTGLSTRTDPAIFLGSSSAGPSSTSPAARRPSTLASSVASTRRTSATSISSVSTAASSVSAGHSSIVSTAEKNRQKQQRYRDRIKDTISSLQSDKARLTEENLELRQRIARVELRNAVLERGEGGDASIAPVGWADSEIDEPEGDVDDDARSWASSALDEGDHEMVADKSDDETTPLGRPETHPANELYSSFTPPVSTHALPPTPQVEQIPTFAPDTRVSPPSVLGLVASQTALGHCLFRTAPPKHVLSGAPSPIFPQSALSFAAGQPAILGTTPSNVLGLQLDSLAVAHPVDNPFDDVRAAHAQREGDEAMTDVDGSAPVAWSFQH